MRRYVVWNPGNRCGEFNFLCSTQEAWTTTAADAILQAKAGVGEIQCGFEPKLSREEAMAELGGKPVVYEITIKKIPYK